MSSVYTPSHRIGSVNLLTLGMRIGEQEDITWNDPVGRSGV